MISPFRHDEAVSETIGAVLLISIVVIAVAIVAAILWSQPAPQKIPAFSASITNASCSVILAHSGGETVTNTTISILIDGADQTINFIKQGSAGPWAMWGIGETLVYTPSIPCILAPQRVDIVYTYGAGRNLLTSVYLENPLSGNFTPRPPVPPAIADFSANTTSGLGPLAVQFMDTSTGSPLAWNWTFGDGGTSTQQHPAHTYSGVNSYTVSLTVDNGTGVGTNTKVRTDYITVYAPPIVADFSGTPTSGAAPLAVTFTDSSTGYPTSWNWIFGDGGTSTAQNPLHTYATQGIYTVNLTVTNASGGRSSLNRTSYITVTPTPPWYCGWSYRKNITIDHTQVAGTQNNFPVLINLASDSDLADGALSSGYDILFTASDGVTTLPHQIEKYTSSSGALVAWVNVSAITSTTDTTIFMYYGNAASSNQQNRIGVWDANYKGVWHLNETVTNERTTGTHYDSTSNNYHGNQHNNGPGTGQVDGAQYLDGTGDWIIVPYQSGLSITSQLTMEAWVYLTNVNNDQKVVGKTTTSPPTRGYILGVQSYHLYPEIWDSAGTHYTFQSGTVSSNQWTHLAVTWTTGGNLIGYVNGAQVNSISAGSNNIGTNTGDLRFGVDPWNSPPSAFLVTGTLDEVRISNTARSAFWIATEYNNQHSPSTFYSLGNQGQWTC